MNPYKWDYRFLDLALYFASWSKDLSTKVGAVIVGPHRNILSTGYNGLPRGVKDEIVGYDPEEEIHRRYNERPYKYKWAEHGERNAIYNAAREGIALDGSTLYVVPMPPCADCARAIIQSGIVRVVTKETPDAATRERWKDDWAVTETMFFEAGVELRSL